MGRRWKLCRTRRAYAKDPSVNCHPFIGRRPLQKRVIRSRYKWQHTNIREALRTGRSGWANKAEFWRAIRHPRLWWSNLYWVGKGGVNRKEELKTRLRYTTTYMHMHSRARWAINHRR